MNEMLEPFQHFFGPTWPLVWTLGKIVGCTFGSASASIAFTTGIHLLMPIFEIGHSPTGIIVWLSRLK